MMMARMNGKVGDARRAAAAAAPALLLASLLLLLPPAADACTRVLYTGANATVLTGRTMDWMEYTHDALWAMPRGVARDGAAGARSLKWTAKYGSVVAVIYDSATVDGINEAGLVANALYLAESDYGSSAGTNKPLLSIAAWAQYALDSFVTAAEAAAALRAEPFRIVAPTLPNGKPAQGHLALSDASGNSAIFEYINGSLTIHEGKQYKVMTNSPSYDKQLAIEAYWRGVGGAAFLPGTSRASDRFARASYLLSALPKTTDPALIAAVPGRSFELQAAASVRSVMQGDESRGEREGLPLLRGGRICACVFHSRCLDATILLAALASSLPLLTRVSLPPKQPPTASTTSTPACSRQRAVWNLRRPLGAQHRLDALAHRRRLQAAHLLFRLCLDAQHLLCAAG